MEDNLGLAHLCARRFVGRGVEYEDLFQAGCVGLVKAAEHFDPSRGVRFSTYAVRGMRDLARQAQAEADRLRRETGRAPSVDQVAKGLGVTPEKAALALGAGQAPLSLTGGEEGEELQIPVEAPEERLTERMTLFDAIGRLEERDRQLIALRYFQGKTQVETARVLGMTQVQVSRREKKLLAFLRGQFSE